MPLIERLGPFDFIDYVRFGVDMNWNDIREACAKSFSRVGADGAYITVQRADGSIRLRIIKGTRCDLGVDDGTVIAMVTGTHTREHALRVYESRALFSLLRNVRFYDEYEIL